MEAGGNERDTVKPLRKKDTWTGYFDDVADKAGLACMHVLCMHIAVAHNNIAVCSDSMLQGCLHCWAGINTADGAAILR